MVSGFWEASTQPQHTYTHTHSSSSTHAHTRQQHARTHTAASHTHTHMAACRCRGQARAHTHTAAPCLPLLLNVAVCVGGGGALQSGPAAAACCAHSQTDHCALHRRASQDMPAAGGVSPRVFVLCLPVLLARRLIFVFSLLCFWHIACCVVSLRTPAPVSFVPLAPRVAYAWPTHQGSLVRGCRRCCSGWWRPRYCLWVWGLWVGDAGHLLGGR